VDKRVRLAPVTSRPPALLVGSGRRPVCAVSRPHAELMPQSITRVWPVTWAAWGPACQRAAWAISSDEVAKLHVGFQAGRRAEAESVTDAARQDAEAAGDRRALALALGMLGRLAVDRRDFAAANARLAAAERLYEEFGNELGLAWISMVGANALVEADQELAARRLDRAERLFTEGGSAWGMANASWIRGVDAARNGDLEQALVRLRHANRLVDDNRLGDEAAPYARSWLAVVLTRLGHHDEARTALLEALAFVEALPDPAPAATWHLALAEAAAALGQHELVLRALGARATVDARTVLPTADDPVHAELLANDARRAVGDAAAEALLLSGASDPDSRRLLAALGERPARPSRPSPPERVVLRRDGARWEVGPSGATFRLPDRKGIRALAHLVSHPSVEVHALEVTAVIEATGAGAIEGLGTGPLLDPTAKAAYRERIADLQHEIDDAGRAHDPVRGDRPGSSWRPSPTSWRPRWAWGAGTGPAAGPPNGPGST
jgi:tetratricopeptide (TPR) repeat protein